MWQGIGSGVAGLLDLWQCPCWRLLLFLEEYDKVCTLTFLKIVQQYLLIFQEKNIYLHVLCILSAIYYTYTFIRTYKIIRQVRVANSELISTHSAISLSEAI